MAFGVVAVVACSSSAGATEVTAAARSVTARVATAWPPSPSPSAGPGSPSSGSRSPSHAATARVSLPAHPGVWEPADAELPPDLAAPSGNCTGVSRQEGWLKAEDAQLGQPGFEIPADTGGPVVLGYADRRSAACGDTVAVSLSGPESVVRLEAYRLGAYRSAMGRLVWQSGDVAVAPRRLPPVQAGTNLREPAWPVSVRIPVTASWPPGFYLLVVHSAGGVAGPAIPLVVRDDTDPAPIMFTASTLTWNAYNEWGGYSLYRGPGASTAARFAARARVASLLRPLVGSGYRQMVYMDVSVVRLLEEVASQAGLDVAYTTDVDADQRPSQWLRHGELVFGGHSEYWTQRAYDALAAARGRGVNLVFLGANNLWWHARLESSPGAVEPDREIVYKTYAGDPTPKIDAKDYSVLWSQWPEHRDAAALLGHSHAAIGVHGGYQVMAAPAWMLAGTGLGPGSVLPLAVGNEADGYNAVAANPTDLTVVAAGVLRGAHGPVTVSTSYYVAPSGAGVFSAGSTDWSCGLVGPCADQQAPAATTAGLRGITRNVLLALTQPQAGRTHPSVPSVPPPPATLLARLAPGAVGTYGGGSDAVEGDGKHSAGQPPPRLLPRLNRLSVATHRAAGHAGPVRKLARSAAVGARPVQRRT